MKTGIPSTVAALLIAASAAHAQNTAPSSASANGDAVVTITGCVTRADMSFASGRQSVDGRAVTSGGDADRFVLAAAKSGATTPSGSAATTGSTDPVAYERRQFELVSTSADLRQHLGHEVEVTGRIQPAAADSDRPTATGTSGSGSSAAQSGSASGGSGGASLGRNEPHLQQLHVTTVKMVASSCTTK